MATEKVGIYRKYHGPVPTDKQGNPLPKSEWPRKRAFSWVVRWFSSDGTRYSRSFKTRKEAEWFRQSKQSDVQNGKVDMPRGISLKEFYKEQRVLMKGSIATATLNMQLATIRLLAKYVGWKRNINKISVSDIERFRAYRLKTGISPASANRELRTLKAVFNKAIARGYLWQTANPCVPIKMIKTTPKQPVYCSPEEFKQIYSAAPDIFWKTLLATIYTTGLRLREATNLTWQDVDFNSCQLYVTAKNSQGCIQNWQPKDYEIRIIPLARQIIDLLTAWRSIAVRECPYVFMELERWKFYKAQIEKGKWRSGQDLVNNLLRRFKTICCRAGVGPYTFHDLRRSCITNWAQHLPIHVVQRLAGHSDIKTTQLYYLSIRDTDIQHAQQIQSKLLGKIPENDLTDPKLTQSHPKRSFPGRKVFDGDV